MMQIIPFEKRHYRAFLAAMMPAPMDHLRSIANQVETATHAMTWLNNGVVMGIGGVTIMWGQVGEAWVLVTPEALQQPIQLWKLCKAYLNEASRDYGRIQATVASDFREGIRWALSLGFSFEGPEGKPSRHPYSKMAGYGPNGEDYYMLAYERSQSWQKSR